MVLWQVLAAVFVAWVSGALFGLGLNAPTRLGLGRRQPAAAPLSLEDLAPEFPEARDDPPPATKPQPPPSFAPKPQPQAQEAALVRPAPPASQPLKAPPAPSFVQSRFIDEPAGVVTPQEVIAQRIAPSERVMTPEPKAKVLDEAAFSAFNQRLNEKSRKGAGAATVRGARKERRSRGGGSLRTWIEVVAASLLLVGAAWGSYYVSVALKPTGEQVP